MILPFCNLNNSMSRLEHIREQVESYKDKPKLIMCRNSYERQYAHNLAQARGLTHRSVIDYRNFHINRKLNDSDCCQGNYTGEISCTPMSYVEIGNGSEKKVIGDVSMLPRTQGSRCFNIHYFDSIIADMKRKKWDTLMKRKLC